MIKQFLIALATFLAIDGVWLALIAKSFYSHHLGSLLSKNPNWWAAGIFYVIYVWALVILVIAPAVHKGSWTAAIIMGAVMGLAAYATYDLTNLATIHNWPLVVTVVDIIWGAVLSGLVAGISYKLVV